MVYVAVSTMVLALAAMLVCVWLVAGLAREAVRAQTVSSDRVADVLSAMVLPPEVIGQGVQVPEDTLETIMSPGHVFSVQDWTDQIEGFDPEDLKRETAREQFFE